MMDQADLPRDEHRQALTGLARLNRFTGVSRDLYGPIRQVAANNPSRRLRVLDVASGSGDLPIAWARRAKREGVRLEISTLDISEFAVEEQLRRAAEAGVRIAAIRKDCLSEPLPTGFDVVTNSLFMHHLEDDEVVALIRAMRQAARRRVVICDLERSRLNLGLVSIGSQLLSRSKVVHHDARLSVRGAYTTAELGNLAERATGECVRVERLFPCRMLVSLDRHQRVR